MVDDKTFAKIGAEMLKKLEAALTDVDDRLEADLAGDVLTLSFADGAKYIVNTHSAAKQIWAAAERRAWHFTPHPDTGQWLEPRDGSELVATLTDVVSRKLGRALTLAVR